MNSKYTILAVATGSCLSAILYSARTHADTSVYQEDVAWGGGPLDRTSPGGTWVRGSATGFTYNGNKSVLANLLDSSGAPPSGSWKVWALGLDSSGNASWSCAAVDSTQDGYSV